MSSLGTRSATGCVQNLIGQSTVNSLLGGGSSTDSSGSSTLDSLLANILNMLGRNSLYNSSGTTSGSTSSTSSSNGSGIITTA